MTTGREPETVPELIAEALAARECRDRWRAVGPVLRALREQGVSFAAIREQTGISPSTAYRAMHWPGSGTSGSGHSETTS